VRHFTPSDSPSEAATLLALRALKLGDLLVAVPAIHGLRRAFPEHELVLAVPGWLEPIVQLVGGVDSILPTRGLDDPLPVPPGLVDVAVNLHGNGPESRGILEALRPARMIAHRSPGIDGPVWLDGILERRRWARLITEHGIPADENDVTIDVPHVPARVTGAVVVHVGAFYGSRQWPVERFAVVASALRALGEEIVITGSEAERARGLQVAALAGLDEESVLAGRTTLDELAAIVASASLVVSADTGAAHLASAYAVPSVVIFGPAPPEEWGPPAGGPHIVLTDASLRKGDTFGSEPDPALLAVTAASVVEAARGLLRAPITR
jgi:ADP-heptose:LPS heptosyltransferase